MVSESMQITVRECERIDRRQWDERVLALPEGNIGQSSQVEDFNLVRTGGFKPIYLLAEDECSRPLAQLVLLAGFAAAQQVLKWRGGRVLYPFFNYAFKSFSWTQGPLIFAKEHFGLAHDAILGYVDKMAPRKVCVIRRVTRPYYQHRDWCERADESFRSLSFTCEPGATFLIDLNQGSEDLWKNLKSSARKSLRRIDEQDKLIIREIESQKDIVDYWSMLVETEKRNGCAIYYNTPEEFRATFWDEAHRADILRGVIVRTAEGNPVAGLLFRCYNKHIQELGVAYSDYSIRAKIYGQDLIKWHLMQWGREKGFRAYDLMGVKPKAEDPKERGIYQYKAKWGGRLYEFPIFGKIYSPWKAALLMKRAKLR